MTSSPTVSPTATYACSHCAHPVQFAAKFCGECGVTLNAVPNTYQHRPAPAHSAIAQAAQRAQYQRQSIEQMNAMANPYNPAQGVTTNVQMPGQSALSHPGQVNMPFPAAYAHPQAAAPAEYYPSNYTTIPQANQQHQQRVTQQQMRPDLSGPLPQQVSVPSRVNYDDLAKLEQFRLAQVNEVAMDWKPTATLGPKGVAPKASSVAPSFAQVGTKSGAIPESLVREMQSLNATILRERFFLIMHTAIFLITNLVGFYIALHCYYGYHGDEVTRIVMALTPLTFINAVALACLSPIKGTRREILRLLEKRQYLRFQIDVKSSVNF